MLHAQFISLNKIKSVETSQNLKSNLLAVLFACASSKKEKMRFIWNGADCLCFRDCAKALNCTSYNLKGFKPKCQTMHISYLSCCLLSSAIGSSLIICHHPLDNVRLLLVLFCRSQRHFLLWLLFPKELLIMSVILNMMTTICFVWFSELS